MTDQGTAIPANTRRYDVDWLRTLAMGLLIFYHVAINFQPWAADFGLPQNAQTLEGLNPLLSLFNIWRIPIVFLISGMGVCFAMARRDRDALIKERTLRILVPFLFAVIVMETLANILMSLMGWDAPYRLSFWHLWFLLNIYLYVILTFALLFWWRDHPDNRFFRLLRRLLALPGGIFLFAVPVMLEAVLVNPEFYTSYAVTPHGFAIGLVCFLTGFIFVALGEQFWPAVDRHRWPALVLAIALYLVRLVVYDFNAVPHWLTGLETMSWMLAILGFAPRYLNRPSRWLAWLSAAVYPVYIVHQPVQYLTAYYLFPLPLAASVKLVVLLGVTFGVSLLLYECVLRRINLLRPLFGMKCRAKGAAVEAV